MEMTLRFEIFPPDLDGAVDFYTRVLRFGLTKDQREDPEAYVAMNRGTVLVGAPEEQFRMPIRHGCRRLEWSWFLRLTTSPLSAIVSWRQNGHSKRISRIVPGA